MLDAGSKYRILFVDDERSALAVLATLFKAEGFEVKTAPGGKEAFEILEKETFDVVWTDIRMSPVNGMEVLSFSRERFPATQVVMCSAFGSVETATHSSKLGAFDYITKPFKVDQVLQTARLAAEYARHCRDPLARQSEAVAVGQWLHLKSFLQQYMVRHASSPDMIDKALRETVMGLIKRRPEEIPATQGQDDKAKGVPSDPAGAPEVTPGEKESASSQAVERQSLQQLSKTNSLYPFLVGGLIHDSLNTIGALNWYVELFQRREPLPDDSSVAKTLTRVKRSSEHLEKVMRLIQTLSREHYMAAPETLVRQTERAEEIVRNFGETHPDITCECHVEPAADRTGLPAGVATFLIEELLENATRGCASTPAPRIVLTLAIPSGSGTLSIECRDSGRGLPPDLIERIQTGQLKPPQRPGTGGYGLYLMHQIVQRLEGKILVSNLPPSGARFEILLPFYGEKP